MRTIGVRELKDRLSEIIRSVRGGEPVLIARHGEVVAELRETYGEHPVAEAPEGLRELARQGALRLGAPSRPDLYPVLDPVLAEGKLAELLAADRGDR